MGCTNYLAHTSQEKRHNIQDGEGEREREKERERDGWIGRKREWKTERGGGREREGGDKGSDIIVCL